MIWQPLRRIDASRATTPTNASCARRTSRKGLRIESLEGRLVLAAPVAVDDSYTAISNAMLNVPAAGVLANDSDPDGDAIRTSLVDNVDHGILNLAADGGFTYLPNPGFTGTDTFSYRAVADPSIVFAVDPAQSSVNATATLRTTLGNRTDSDSTRVSGTVTTKLTPTTSPFTTAHVQDMDLLLIDPLTFEFSFGGLLGAVLTASSPANTITVSMEQPGEPAAVGAGSFVQTNNNLRVAGQADLSCNGLLCGSFTIPPNPQIFDADGVITDIQGTLSQTASTITLAFPVNFVGTFDLGDGNFLDLTLAGSVRATGQASPPPDQSNIATATITTVPPVETQPDTYHTREDTPLVVSSAAVPRTETLLPRGSLWRYIDDGSNQGTAWRELGFAETGWKGPVEAEFGYGDGGEGTVIICDPNPADGCADTPTDLNDNFITSYFRRRLVLDQVDDIHELVIRLRRDDGAAVYVNGVEVVRDNLAAGAAFDTPASATASDDGATFIEFIAPADMLVVGTNVVAVEVHQASASSSDVSFDLELAARRGNLSVLANDRNNAGGALSASVVTQPVHGTLSLNAAGGFTYSPAANYNGPDSFTYRATPTTPPETVTLVVDPVDDAPSPVADGPYNASVGTPLVVDAAAGVLANDGDLENDPLSAIVYSEPSLGTLSLSADGGFTYTPLVAGSDSFSYRAVQDTTFVPFGSRWTFLDNGTDQGTAWQAAAFDDSAWATGVGELGYGDGDETMLVGYGTSGSNKYVTTYFRREFYVDNTAALAEVVARAIRDDGIAVYVNGTEVGRDNLPAGALFNTLAGPNTIGGADESTPVAFNVPASLLVNGRNVIAVEVHQAAANSSDMSFDLDLSAKLLSAPADVSIESTGSATAPRVTSVEVQGSAWSTAFRGYLDASDLGSGGYAIPDASAGGDQLATLPWSNLTSIALNFSEHVDPATLTAASLVGASVGDVPLAEPITSVGPAGTLFAIWNLAGGATLAADRYTFTLGDLAATPGGALLDGEWTTGASSFPSGNGAAGGDFAFEFRVLPGDADRDAAVDLADVAANVAAGFRTTADAGYSPFHDIDGSGVVNFADAIGVRNHLSASVPSPAAADAIVTAASARSRTITTRAAGRADAARGAAVDRAFADATRGERGSSARLTAVRSLPAGIGEEGIVGIRPRSRSLVRSATRAELLGGPLG
ncbi:MAG: hypothetical protein DCC68_07185 [Planctomycetota bacterium]|nr:MAG: hypothetical protein DCC68_07185 [Planctomycetota bacterium]